MSLLTGLRLRVSPTIRFKGKLQRVFKGTLLFDIPMSYYTTLRVGGSADIVAFPLDEEDVRNILLLSREMEIPYCIVGRGSNLLVKDGGIRGVVVNLSRGFGKMELVDNNKIRAESGITLGQLVRFAKDKGVGGLEFAVGIPGSLGGAIAMNAGAYGCEMGDLVEWIEVMGEEGCKVSILRNDLAFRYRGLAFNPSGIILRALLKLERRDVKEIEDRMNGFISRREATQRINLPSAGSIFRNPPEASAGRLIDELGLKGLKEGRAMVSEVHGNYIVNLGGATSTDVLKLVKRVSEAVFLKRGISLELEVKVVGED